MGVKVAVASGKGGTGKTFVATNLVSVIGGQLVDCDVEEPNAHLFLKPRMERMLPVTVTVPRVDESKCDHCRRCAEACRYHALLVLSDRVLFFEELCHSCGVCRFVCPHGAIWEEEKEIGQVRIGEANGVRFIGGVLRVGEPRAVPVIKEAKAQVDPQGPCILDAPPGTSCPAIETVKGSDFCLLVTEPTPFGISDLKMAVEAFRKLGVKMGVVINRCDLGEGAREFCLREGLEVLCEIPFDSRISQVYADGHLVVDKLPEYEEVFRRIWKGIRKSVG